jgi:putative peptide zinc metalloprotease protein
MTGPVAEPALAVGPASVVVLHPLAIRPDDDDADVSVVGRAELGEFVELPTVAAEAISLLGAGKTVADAEEEIERRHDVRLDLAELVEALADLGFVASLNGAPVADPAGGRPGGHLRWLKERHVRWLFSRPAAALWTVVVAAALLTWWRDPGTLPAAADFFWSPYVGLVVLVNTAMLSAHLSVHELMHLAAARSYGAPARISFATRLHHLVVQTDVTAVWAVPRKLRYRVYLAGMFWDSLVICGCTLLAAHAGLPAGARQFLGALTLVVVFSLVMQAHVYMRTDLYYVLMEWLRCRNLFQDSVDYVKHLARRVRRRPSADPTTELAARERRAVRVYAVAMAGGSVIALGVFAWFGLPIVVNGVRLAFSGLVGGLAAGDTAHVVDSSLIIAVEGALQAIFVVTFIRRHRHARRP